MPRHREQKEKSKMPEKHKDQRERLKNGNIKTKQY